MPISTEIRNQLEETLKEWPKRGDATAISLWLRSIRMALGMSSRQLAERMGVKPPRITEMEKAEGEGALTLKSLQRAAAAMDCDLIYALRPRKGLDATLRDQARKAAVADMQKAAHTMRLENQGLTESETVKQIGKTVEAWVANPPRWLWDVR